jgi:phospholipid/cholesterol/gamma-HCH transport system permease protein
MLKDDSPAQSSERGLILISNLFGILAGGMFMYFRTKMTPLTYLRDVANSILLRDVFTGLLKSLVFATIVVQVGCMEGFKVQGGPDAVGRSTTSAVVRSTLLVILADLFFTAIFYFAHGK